MEDAETKQTQDLLSQPPLGSQGDGELNRTQYVFLGLLCPVKNILSFRGLLPPCLVFMPCIHLPWTWVEGCGYEPPTHVPRFSSHQPSTWTPMPPFFLLFLCLPPTRIWELYKDRPTVFWVLFFLVFSTKLTTEEVLKELFFHKKLTYEECNSLEAVWDAGRTKGKNFFQSLQAIWGIGF